MEFEPNISAGERPQDYALERAATGTGTRRIRNTNTQCVYIASRRANLHSEMHIGQELNLAAGESVSFGDGDVVVAFCLFNSPFMGLK